MLYRKLKVDDYESYSILREKALRDSPESFASTNEEEVNTRKERFSAIANHHTNFILGAFDGNVLVGMAGFMKDEKTKLKHKGMIWGMFVSTDIQGRGIGKSLLQEAINIAFKDSELLQIKLAVVSTNQKAISLYEKLGFTTYGVEKKSLQAKGKFYDDFLMVKFRDDLVNS